MRYATRQFDEGGPSLAATGESRVLELLVSIAREAASSLDRDAGGQGAAPAADDGAVWLPPPGRQVVLSQDAIVEGVDFERAWMTPYHVGAKAMAVALSDLAGMGAEPAWALATLCAPPSTCLEDVAEIQRGLCDVAAAAGCAVLGGDVSAIEGPLVIDVSVGGTIEPGRSLRRDTGRPGDALLVTGELGGAAAGLAVLREGDVRRREAGAWVERQRAPGARIAEARAAVAGGARCGGDISDGLWHEAGRLATASGCGADLWLDVLPLAPGLRQAFPARWAELALGGGEDFELLLSMPAATAAALSAAWPDRLAPLTHVGRLTPGGSVRLFDTAGGAEVAAPPIRSRHFGSNDD